MKLVGMLDSPYVRRVAICLDMLGVPFQSNPVSVFRTFEEFRAINPVVKAPTLVLDDGNILMDSSLIIDYVERLTDRQHLLWSPAPATRMQQFRALGFALAGCEKSVQLVYEINLRPPESRHDPWMTRIRLQQRAAFEALEDLVSPDRDPGIDLDHATIFTAVSWQFLQSQPAACLTPESFPRLRQLSQRCEALPVFRRWPPTGPGVPALGAS